MRERVPMGLCSFDSLNIHGSDYRGGDSGQFGNWFVSHWDEKLRTLLSIDSRVSKIKGIFPADELLAHLVCYPVTITLLTLRVFFYILKDPTVVTTIAFFNYNWCWSALSGFDSFEHWTLELVNST